MVFLFPHFPSPGAAPHNTNLNENLHIKYGAYETLFAIRFQHVFTLSFHRKLPGSGGFCFQEDSLMKVV